MRISEIIFSLNEIKEKHGDLECLIAENIHCAEYNTGYAECEVEYNEEYGKVVKFI